MRNDIVIKTSITRGVLELEIEGVGFTREAPGNLSRALFPNISKSSIFRKLKSMHLITPIFMALIRHHLTSSTPVLNSFLLTGMARHTDSRSPSPAGSQHSSKRYRRDDDRRDDGRNHRRRTRSRSLEVSLSYMNGAKSLL